MKTWLTVAEAAEYAGISRDTIYTACERRELRGARVGGRSAIRLKPEWIDARLEQHARGANHARTSERIAALARSVVNGDRLLRRSRTGGHQDRRHRGLLADLKLPRVVNRQPGRRLAPASINREIEVLRHMMNWAVGREYLERTPFRRGTETLIRKERVDNQQRRRLEGQLLAVATPFLRSMIITALDTGMRQGEMLAMRCSKRTTSSRNGSRTTGRR